MSNEKTNNGCAFKGARIEKSEAGQSDMAAINKLTLAELGPDDVYTFRSPCATTASTATSGRSTNRL